MDVDIKVEGLQELEMKLKKLGAEVAVKELGGALMNASLPTFKAAKNAAPGGIKKAVSRANHRGRTLKLSRFGRRAGGKQAAGVSVIVRKNKAPHAHLIHNGTDVRYSRAGAHRGKVEPNPFLLNAWESQGGNKALDRFKSNLKKRIDKLTRK